MMICYNRKAGAIFCLIMLAGFSGLYALSPMANALEGRFTSGGQKPAVEKKIKRQLDLKPFKFIDIIGKASLVVTIGKDQSIFYEVEETLDHLVTITVEDSVLTLETESEPGSFFWGGRKEPVPNITISVPSLEALYIRGSADGTIKDLDAETFQLTFTGAGNINLEGRCGRLTADFRGVGNIEASALLCKQVDAVLKGAGTVSVYASNKADLFLKGIGNITIAGDPEILKKRINGIGSIEKNE